MAHQLSQQHQLRDGRPLKASPNAYKHNATKTVPFVVFHLPINLPLHLTGYNFPLFVVHVFVVLCCINLPGNPYKNHYSVFFSFETISLIELNSYPSFLVFTCISHNTITNQTLFDKPALRLPSLNFIKNKTHFVITEVTIQC